MKFQKKKEDSQALDVKVLMPPSGATFRFNRLGEDYQADAELSRNAPVSKTTTTPIRLMKQLKTAKGGKTGDYTVELHVWTYRVTAWLFHTRNGVTRVCGRLDTSVGNTDSHEDRKKQLQEAADMLPEMMRLLLAKAVL